MNQFMGTSVELQTSTVTKTAIAGFTGPGQRRHVAAGDRACDFPSIQSCFATPAVSPS